MIPNAEFIRNNTGMPAICRNYETINIYQGDCKEMYPNDTHGVSGHGLRDFPSILSTCFWIFYN